MRWWVCLSPRCFVGLFAISGTDGLVLSEAAVVILPQSAIEGVRLAHTRDPVRVPSAQTTSRQTPALPLALPPTLCKSQVWPAGTSFLAMFEVKFEWPPFLATARVFVSFDIFHVKGEKRSLWCKGPRILSTVVGSVTSPSNLEKGFLNMA